MADNPTPDISEEKQKADRSVYNTKLLMRFKIQEANQYLDLLKGRPVVESVLGNMIQQTQDALEPGSNGLTKEGVDDLCGKLVGAMSIVDAFIKSDYKLKS